MANRAASLLEAKKTYIEGANGTDDLQLKHEYILKAAECCFELSKCDGISRSDKEKYSIQGENYLKAAKAMTSRPTVQNERQETSTTQEVKSTSSTIRFSDVSGLDEVKDQVEKSVIYPLQYPELAKKWGIKPGCTILLYGAPGTGKTYIVEAIAGEIGAKLYKVNCQDVVDSGLGDTSHNLQKIFDQASKDERAVLFFDEFEAIAQKRDNARGECDQEMGRVVTTLLTNTNNLTSGSNGHTMILIAATNKPWSIDEALLRGGRFDNIIYVDVPDFNTRKSIISKQLSHCSLSNDFDIDEMTRLCNGFGGGDIKSICDKLKNDGFVKSIKDSNASITRNDYIEIINNQHNVITPEMLKEFNDFKTKQR